MAIAIALPGFNDLGRSLSPIYLLMDHFHFRFWRKNEENLRIINLIFLQNAPSSSIFFLHDFSLLCAGVLNASCRVKFCGNVDNIWNY